ncbi:hypothetical protein PFISCL1PPCAC_5600 [Pristionchus fissidentatus]|uniref:IRS-type PTB domain-containing protein n=1 Tax=Pristionchus fissidentatus TaxID=1538716 RepID=A0AAV5V7Q5_9BILA|nr:hypothetical protein PFISCL1PPCAC_5600 [Pristionchus fissidentatus]
MGNSVSGAVVHNKELIKGFKKGASSEPSGSSPLPTTTHDEATQMSSFRVYIHRRNKFIHAWLRVSPSVIILEKSKTDVTTWPLQFLRRYGYTSAGIFFFESGRRCPTGEGLHTFQSHSAEAIFQLVQSRIQDSANASAVESMRMERARSAGASVSSSIGLQRESPRIHPLQRYSSEGSSGDYMSVHGGSYNTIQPPSSARIRRVVAAAPPRPRSVSGGEERDERRGGVENGDRGARAGSVTSSLLPPDSFHPMRNSNAGIVGQIMTEKRVRPSTDVNTGVYRKAPRGSETDPNAHEGQSYANVTPPSTTLNGQHHLPPSSRFIVSGAGLPPSGAGSMTSVVSVGASSSQPPTPTRTVFPIKWDGGAGSTSFLCYANTTNRGNHRERADTCPNMAGASERYVNLQEMAPSTRHYEPLSPPHNYSPLLNYASVESTDELQSRSNSVGSRSELPLPLQRSERLKHSPAPLATVEDDEESLISYSQIDMLRTQALREVSEQSEEERRRARNGSRPLTVE